MPGFNATGPFGAGPMSGRAGGYCNPNFDAIASFRFGEMRCRRNAGSGRRFRAGTRAGVGQRLNIQRPESAFLYPKVSDYPRELDMLKAQADSFERALDAIHKRIKEMEGSSE